MLSSLDGGPRLERRSTKCSRTSCNAHSSFTKAGEALTKPEGQSLARWIVLAQCRDAPAPGSEIARRLRLVRQSVQRLADVLVEDGLCAYRDNPQHRRAKLLELTSAGRSTLDAIDGAQRQWCDELGNAIGESTLWRAATALARVIEAVEKANPEAQANK